MNESLIVLPTFNEAANIELLAQKLTQFEKFDLLIIDDCSPDGTGDVADDLKSQYSEMVDVIHRPGKLGLGTAYVEGFKRALSDGYKFVFQMDADFSHDPSYLPHLRNALDVADVAIGSRYVSGGGTENWPLWRRLLSRGGSLYAGLILGMPVHDVTGGFKGFRRHVLESIGLDRIQSNGYSFQIEMTYRCFRNSYRIAEVPIVFVDRKIGDSKMSKRIFLEALMMVWKLRLKNI